MEDLQRLEQSLDVSCSENMHDVIDGSLFESENRETGDVEDRKVAEDPEIDIEQFDETLLDRIIDECQSEENSEDLESEWEHQDLIEQLKMELKKVRSIGLPTILEESESLKSIEDLKPWKMDEKFLHEDPMDELHKFYKCYRERMRKFDILNYQKMYAMGFLRLKDPLQSMSSQRTLFPMISSILSHNLWLCNRRKSNGDMSVKFIKELQSDLEVVYVGQACLSWEFLCWQYQKAWELPESDRYGARQYNQVAGEFQQFQVLLHRFLEDEAFQGPRVQNYAKNRCVLRKLIQVPVIKDDSLNERKGDGGMSNEALRVLMWNSIRVFWEFIKADKDKTSTILKGLMRAQPELQDLADSELMSEVQAHLQKKEKRLKDLLRVGNCIVKNFQHKREEDASDQALFFSQVDIKLVARVLRMSRITSEQLGWCQEKLNKIAFVGRKAHREASFMPFPC
ncbi:hypothetical protein QJS10_CPB21g00653 [Acorus calamus]|uniref:Ribosomal protein L34Ae n=1 Tax=Acorus calamus TaxID=4465 RepID=A0AAV9C472_ACOCL|nr:hypothetical protein QJS10_CPB21g00653 [Acorus calamus]